MWLFGRKARARALPPPDGWKGEADAPQILQGPHMIRRTEITVEREWTSTVRRTSEPPLPEIVVEKGKGDERD
jgi:hypothetical protein